MLVQPILGILVQQHQKGWSTWVRPRKFSWHWLDTLSCDEHFSGVRLTVGAVLIYSYLLDGRVVTYQRPHSHWGIEPGFAFKPSEPVTQTSCFVPASGPEKLHWAHASASLLTGTVMGRVRHHGCSPFLLPKSNLSVPEEWECLLHKERTWESLCAPEEEVSSTFFFLQ